MSTIEEQGRALERGLRQRDPALLEALVEQYQYRLLRYLIHLSGNRALAEDLFQETWLRVLERGRQYNPRYRFESWLFVIARNLFLDRVRRKSEVGWAELDGEDAAAQVPDLHAASPFDLYCHQQEQESMERHLAKLTAPCREVLALRFQEELSLEEIAGIVAAPLSTVKSRLYRGLAQLQAWMREEKASGEEGRA